jgi:hypothetical protein
MTTKEKEPEKSRLGPESTDVEQTFKWGAALEWAYKHFNKSEKNYITNVQEKLERLGYLKNGEYRRGVFDKNTFNAICKFQEDNKLTVDGKWGKKTEKAAQKELKMRAVPERVKEAMSYKIPEQRTTEGSKALMKRLVESNWNTAQVLLLREPVYKSDFYENKVRINIGGGAQLEIVIRNDKTKTISNKDELKDLLINVLNNDGTTKNAYIESVELITNGGLRNTSLYFYEPNKNFTMVPRGGEESYWISFYDAIAPYAATLEKKTKKL